MDEGRVEEGRVVGWGWRPTVLPSEQRKGKSTRDQGGSGIWLVVLKMTFPKERRFTCLLVNFIET